MIKTDMFDELKERLEAAADAAHEEYCDAVRVNTSCRPCIFWFLRRPCHPDVA